MLVGRNRREFENGKVLLVMLFTENRGVALNERAGIHAIESVLFRVACAVFFIAWSIVVGILMSFSGWLALARLPLRLLIRRGLFVLCFGQERTREEKLTWHFAQVAVQL